MTVFPFARTFRPTRAALGSISTRDPVNNPITPDALRRAVPSIFAEEAHDSRSDRYAYIPTMAVLEAMTREGFQVVHARQSRTRDEGRREHTKHMIRLRHAGTQVKAVGDVFPEIVLVNSHDGTSSYQISAGLFRLACTNGMVVADQRIETTRVSHSGDPRARVIEGSFSVLQGAVTALEAPREWSGIGLGRDAREALAEAAHVLRFADADGETTTPIKPTSLLVPRRYDDRKDDLWTTFNVVQENVIRGGITGTGQDADGRPRRTTSRAVNGIDQDVRLNKALWILGEKMAGMLRRAA